MNKRLFIRKALLSLGAVGLVSHVKAQPKKVIKGRFIHMVYFWLTPEANADTFIQNTEDFLKKVDVIRGYHLGKPAGTPREVVDNSYSVSLVVTFDSKEDQDIYQKHEAHLKYIEDNNTQWTEVKIYDSWGAL
ncbi:Dabb family protein [Marinoscillum sp.]|uniref:Dabb family protein n=1 Tax=Marinoscillum sp. TaxID=2024838 RepID=UPI003BAA5E6D